MDRMKTKKIADSCNCQHTRKVVPYMRNYKHYNRYEKESKVFAVVMIIVLMLMISVMILEVCGMFDEPLWKPDVEYPMVNTNVSWMQTPHFGSWSDAG